MSHLMAATLVGALSLAGGCMLGKDKKLLSAAIIYTSGILVGRFLI